MTCKCYREISDFPEKWKHILSTIKVKEEIRDKLQNATILDIWTQDITRLTQEIGYLLTGLPEDIKEQYLRIRLRDSYKEKWINAVMNGDEDAEIWLNKYKKVFECCSGGKCECRVDNNG